MAKNTQHVIPNRQGGWSVKKGGASRVTQTFSNKTDAIKKGISISRNQKAELFIHKNDGTIMKRSTY